VWPHSPKLRWPPVSERCQAGCVPRPRTARQPLSPARVHVGRVGPVPGRTGARSQRLAFGRRGPPRPPLRLGQAFLYPGSGMVSWAWDCYQGRDPSRGSASDGLEPSYAPGRDPSLEVLRDTSCARRRTRARLPGTRPMRRSGPRPTGDAGSIMLRERGASVGEKWPHGAWVGASLPTPGWAPRSGLDRPEAQAASPRRSRQPLGPHKGLRPSERQLAQASPGVTSRTHSVDAGAGPHLAPGRAWRGTTPVIGAARRVPGYPFPHCVRRYRTERYQKHPSTREAKRRVCNKIQKDPRSCNLGELESLRHQRGTTTHQRGRIGI
jgi:hypothetical protein